MVKEKRLQGSCLGCRISWKKILATKCDHGVFKRNGIEYTYHTVGSGITKGNCLGYKTMVDYYRSVLSSDSFLRLDVSTFDKEVSHIEEEALQIINKAGFLPPPGDDSTLPWNEENCKKLLDTLEKKGFRRHQDREWYAAMILSVCADLRDSIDMKKNNKIIAVHALALGKIVREVEIRFGIIAEYSRAGGLKSKFDPAIMRFVKSRLKKTPAVTAKTLLEELSEKDPFGGAIRVGNAKLFAERDRIKVYHNGKERSISFSSFPRYVTEARKNLTHPSSRTIAK